MQILLHQRLKPCIISTTTTNVPGLPLSVPTTTVTLRVFEPCGCARPNEQGPGVLMSDAAHRLADVNTLSQKGTSHRSMGLDDGMETEGAFLGTSASLLDPESRVHFIQETSAIGCSCSHRYRPHPRTELPTAKLFIIAAYRIAPVCRRF